VDCRRVALDCVGSLRVGRCLSYCLREYFDREKLINSPGTAKAYVGGIGVGGGLLVGAVLANSTSMLEYNGFIVRETPKGHGLNRAIEGHIGNDAPIFLVEDVITTGMSIATAGIRVREAGYKLAGIVALLDREEGGVSALRATFDVPIKVVLTASQLKNCCAKWDKEEEVLPDPCV
jgi:orotate phosphoribosyltransferase